MHQRRAEAAQREPSITGELEARVSGKVLDAASAANRGDMAASDAARDEAIRMVDAETTLSADKRAVKKKEIRRKTANDVVEALALTNPAAADKYADDHKDDLADAYLETKTKIRPRAIAAKATEVVTDVMSGAGRTDTGEHIHGGRAN